MKNRLYVFLIATMLLTLLGVSSDALSTSIDPFGNPNAETSPASELSGDTVIHFPDPNFEAAVRAIIAKPEGVVTAGDVAEITELELSGLGIADLTGIEHFTALKEFNCSRNSLTALDVSRNTALEILNCSMNNLTVLDVSRNVALKKLDCYYSGLKSLNLSGAVALEWVECSMNSLKELDIRQNLALVVLVCDGNRLTSLEVSHLPGLESLWCSENELMMLDVSRNFALEELLCSSNRLVSLDVSQNPVLDSLHCEDNLLTTLDVSQNPALTVLCCKGNQLTELDVSQNVALAWLYCDNNQLSMLDISRNTKLIGLTCSENQLTELDVRLNVELNVLEVQYNLFPDQSAVLRRGGNRPSPFGFAPQGRFETPLPPQSSGDTIIQFPDPKFEAAVRDEIGKPKGDITVADVAEITTLRVDKQGIADLTGIEHFTSLEVLRCEGNQLTELDVSKNTKLTDLYCQWNKLTALSVSPKAPLVTIYCHDNRLTTLDVRLDAERIEYFFLYCYNNHFPNESAIAGLDIKLLGPVVFDPQFEE